MTVFRAFFLRGVPKETRCILGLKQCQMNPNSKRYYCRLCRYQRCLKTGMIPEKVNRYLNRRKEREEVVALNRRSVIKLRERQRERFMSAIGMGKPTPMIREGGENKRAATQTSKHVTSTDFPPEKETWQNEQQGPLDMRIKPKSFYSARNERPTWLFQQAILMPTDYKNSQDSLIKDIHTYPDTVRRTSPESSTASSSSSLTHISTRKPCSTEWKVRKDEKEEKSKEARKGTMENNPVMPFTLEEEFKIMDFIVRIEDYLAKRVFFINKNFGYSVCLFQSNVPLTMENPASTDPYRKLPYNPNMEGRLLQLGLKFIQLNIDNFFDDMKLINNRVKITMLETSFPAIQIIFYGLLETNNWPKQLNPPATKITIPNSTIIFFGILETNNSPQQTTDGFVKVGQIRMKDMEKFTSPWAIDYEDEVKFENTVRNVGEALGSDLKLQALYTMLVLITPGHEQVERLISIWP